MVAVSACLLGLNCRYDGKNKRNEDLLHKLKCYEVVPFCPEVNILGSPRETIDLFLIENEILAIGSDSKRDFTKLLENEAQRFYNSFSEVDIFYFKSKSPSCALKSAKIYDKDYNLCNEKGMGIFAKKIKELYSEAKFVEVR
ncbi:DUF523 domain-containing protein [Nitrosophilus kaiyonis]|uniref:DUF523 domain-containing protein n=1 Tax=Nitrosophilus kaiyonis TaxID=2930200 RepID=UPI002492783E|nr:DUF523 domain-containing protein [Nitrosophilus kaiyonis]